MKATRSSNNPPQARRHAGNFRYRRTTTAGLLSGLPSGTATIYHCASTASNPAETHCMPQENETLTTPLGESDAVVQPRGDAPPPSKLDGIAIVSTPRGSGSTSPPPPALGGRLTTDSAAEASEEATTPAAAAAAGAPTTAGQDAKKGYVGAGWARGVTDGEDHGAKREGGGNKSGCAPAGLVSLNGVSFRWASGREEDEHAEIFRNLMDVKKKKRKVRPTKLGLSVHGVGDGGMRIS